MSGLACPKCHDLAPVYANWCPTCGASLTSARAAPAQKGRRRSFCRFCGALTTYLDYCCAAHRDVLALDVEPPDPLESLPMQSADLGEAVEAPEGKAG